MGTKIPQHQETEANKPWHCYSKLLLQRIKSHNIKILRPESHNIEIPRPKSHNIEFLRNPDPCALSGGIRVRIPQELDVVAFWPWNLDVVVF